MFETEEDTPYFGRFSIGTVLLRTVTVIIGNGILFVVMSLLGWGWVVVAETATARLPPWGDTIVSVAAASLLLCVLEGAAAYAAYRTLGGGRAGIFESLAKGLSRFAPLLLTSAGVVVSTAVGFSLLVFPGLAALCLFWVAVPACAAERAGTMDSLLRSVDLVKGRLPALIILLFPTLAVFALSDLAVRVAVVFASGQDMALAESAGKLVTGVQMALYAVVSAVLYYELRSDMERVEVARMTDMFA